MKSPETLMNSVLALLMESDRAARRAALENCFQPDARFQDNDGEFVGYDGLERLSDSLQVRFPKAQFTLSACAATGNAIRALWAYGPIDGLGTVTGADFAILDGDRISLLYAFVDPLG
jgi:hypothetical protein